MYNYFAFCVIVPFEFGIKSLVTNRGRLLIRALNIRNQSNHVIEDNQYYSTLRAIYNLREATHIYLHFRSVTYTLHFSHLTSKYSFMVQLQFSIFKFSVVFHPRSQQISSQLSGFRHGRSFGDAIVHGSPDGLM